MLKFYVCIIILCSGCSYLFAQKVTAEFELANQYRQVVVPANGADTNQAYLVQVQQQQAITSRRLKVLKRVSAHYYIITSSTRPGTGNGIITVDAAGNLWKASDNLMLLYRQRPKTKIVLELTTEHADAALLQRLAGWGTVLSHTQNTVVLKTQLDKLPDIVQMTAVQFVSPVRKAHEELAVSDLDLGINKINAVQVDEPDLKGAGINLAIKEEQFDTDLDLLGRSFSSFAASGRISTHATTMATLIAGNGTSFITGLGAAPQAKITSSTFDRLLPDSSSVFQKFNISLQNHSYGTGIENYYGTEAVAYDKQVYEADTLLHVFSAGNIGTMAPDVGLYNGIANRANLSGTFKQAKNVLVIGGTNRAGVPEALSSGGPAYDGRIKPELVASGADGTSGAAALVSGTMALLQQAYKTQYGRLPSAALLKAIAINSADDIGNSGPDFKTGYGQMNALEAVRTLREGRFETGVLKQQQATDFWITIPEGSAQVKVSLTWNDVPAGLNAPMALVNDLDLEVTTPAGKTLLPWCLSSYPLSDSLAAPAVRRRDSVNNTEQVTLHNPQAGTYTIRIKGHSISSAAQQFYIAYQAKAANQFEWTYPAAGDHVFAGEQNYLRWQSTYPGGNGIISLSYDRGATWQEIGNTGILNAYFLWRAPQSFTTAMLKMNISGKEYVSKEFNLSSPLNLKVGFNCTDGTLIHWNPQAGATSYILYTLKDNRLQRLASVTDTMAIIPAVQQTSNYYAISAAGNGFEGIKSYTINAAEQGIGCYVASLLAEADADMKVNLKLQLGSVLNLKSITWQKLTAVDQYSNIGTSILGNSVLAYTFTDNNPKTGINYYRVAITTNTGTVIYSDRVSAVLLQDRQFALYPNPVSNRLNILSSNINSYILKIYDVTGKLRLQQTFGELQNSINVDMNAGVYLYTISEDNKILTRGKLIKL